MPPRAMQSDLTPRPSLRRPEGPLLPDASTLFALVAAMYPVSQLVRTVVDRPVTVYDVTGTAHFVSNGRAGPLVLLGMAVLATALAIDLLFRVVNLGGWHVSSWAVVAFVIAVAMLFRDNVDNIDLLFSALTLVVILAAGMIRVTASALALVGTVTAWTATSLLVFAVLDPGQGWAECRSDKCTLAGGLLRGYFPQENVVGMFLVGLLPTVAYMRRPWLRRASLVLVVASVVLSGSRTSLLILPLAFWAYATARRRSDWGRFHGDAAKVVSLIPIMGYLASLGLVFALPDDALTGRGLIFRIVREAWLESPVLGPGRGVLQEAYYSGSVNWYVAHEHGEGAYILSAGGLVGAVVFTVALCSIVLAAWRDHGPMPALLSLVPALGFLTEPTWEFSLRAAYFTPLLLTVSLVTVALRGATLPVPEGGSPLKSIQATPPPFHPPSGPTPDRASKPKDPT